MKLSVVLSQKQPLELFHKKAVLKNFAECMENICVRVFFNKDATLLKRNSGIGVLLEFCIFLRTPII